MKRLVPFGALFGLAALGACTDSTPAKAPAPALESQSQAILDGEPANEAAYNAVGALVLSHFVVDPVAGEMKELRGPFCTATLIAPSKVLTAKHCARILKRAPELREASTFFAMGPNTKEPTRLVPLAEHFDAPGDEGGFVHMGRDVAVVELAEEITDVEPAELGALEERMVGESFEVVGYGFQDAEGTLGTRKKGTVPLSALEGKVFAEAFGSFEAFHAWIGELFPQEQPQGEAAELGLTDAGTLVAMFADESDLEAEAEAMGEREQERPARDEAYWRKWYDETKLLAGYEAFLGREPGGAQPCFGDSGGPLLRITDAGALKVFGVASGGLRANEACDHGTVFATFGPEVEAFLRDHRREK